jgi:hypothetical protein
MIQSTLVVSILFVFRWISELKGGFWIQDMWTSYIHNVSIGLSYLFHISRTPEVFTSLP